MTVRVLVLEKPSKKPIQYVPVHLLSESRSFHDYTDRKGWAYFDNVIDDKYIIKVRSSRHRPYTKKEFVSRNSIIEIKLEKAIM